MSEIIDLLKNLISRKFYGSLEIKFQNGVPLVCIVHESIKIDKAN